jgi:hypothetical protein
VITDAYMKKMLGKSRDYTLVLLKATSERAAYTELPG